MDDVDGPGPACAGVASRWSTFEEEALGWDVDRGVGSGSGLGSELFRTACTAGKKTIVSASERNPSWDIGCVRLRGTTESVYTLQAIYRMQSWKTNKDE